MVVEAEADPGERCSLLAAVELRESSEEAEASKSGTS